MSALGSARPNVTDRGDGRSVTIGAGLCSVHTLMTDMGIVQHVRCTSRVADAHHPTPVGRPDCQTVLSFKIGGVPCI